MMNKALFKAAIAAAGLTQQELAKRIGMAETTVIAKVKKNSFTIGEASDIGDVLKLSKEEVAHIFLA